MLYRITRAVAISAITVGLEIRDLAGRGTGPVDHCSLSRRAPMAVLDRFVNEESVLGLNEVGCWVRRRAVSCSVGTLVRSTFGCRCRKGVTNVNALEAHLFVAIRVTALEVGHRISAAALLPVRVFD